MSTFSETEINGMFQKAELPMEAAKYMLKRVHIIKEVLGQFEKESGMQCVFKDEKGGGLIIIKKIKE